MADLWQRQPWDTATSYSRFQRYYLTQELPRSLDKAWREFASQKRGVPVTQITSRAGRHWRAWFEAKDGQGQPIPGAVGWRARADAYEEYMAQQRLEQYEAERQARQEELRALATAAFGKLVVAWQAYNPRTDELKLTELASAFRVITQEMRVAYDLQAEQKHRHVHVSWRDEVQQLLQSGHISAKDVREVLGDELAAELFKSASATPAAD